jgi:hypothetical protein
MEDHRLAVTPEAALDYFQRGIESIDGVAAHFGFNPDEVGHEECADRYVGTCFVSVLLSGNQVGCSVSRAGKRITLLACIAADGSYAMPLVIIPRKTIDEDFWLTGMTPEEVMILSESKGYIDIAIFEEWFIEIVPPELHRRYELHTYERRANMILDDCTLHGTEGFHALCSENNAVPLFSPATHPESIATSRSLILSPHEVTANSGEPHACLEDSDAAHGTSSVCVPISRDST